MSEWRPCGAVSAGLQCSGRFAGGMWADLRRCIPKYWSDFRDGGSLSHSARHSPHFVEACGTYSCVIIRIGGGLSGWVGQYTLRKTIAASVFVYFTSALSAIAFGILLEENTEGFFS